MVVDRGAKQICEAEQLALTAVAYPFLTLSPDVACCFCSPNLLSQVSGSGKRLCQVAVPCGT